MDQDTLPEGLFDDLIPKQQLEPDPVFPTQELASGLFLVVAGVGLLLLAWTLAARRQAIVAWLRVFGRKLWSILTDRRMTILYGFILFFFGAFFTSYYINRRCCEDEALGLAIGLTLLLAAALSLFRTFQR